MIDPLDHLGLVHHWAHHFHRMAPDCTEYDDLVQMGFLGLHRASQKYDAERGTTFATYATWWIRQAIIRELKRTQPTIRVPDAWPMDRRIPVGSLNVPVGDGETELGDLLPTEPGDDSDARERILAVLGTLDRRDAQVLRLRYGIRDEGEGHPMTLAEVARVLRVTRERVRQLQDRAEDRLRRRLVG